MTPGTQTLTFSGDVLRRGFWLYAWEITTPGAEKVCYVGRTGDSSSQNAQSPFNRMGQHLGFNAKNNVLRRRLGAWGVVPEDCRFQLVAHGPLLGEAETPEGHAERRDIMAALEKALADELKAAGYDVMNTVSCSKPLDPELFAEVRAAFAGHFPALEEPNEAGYRKAARQVPELNSDGRSVT